MLDLDDIATELGYTLLVGYWIQVKGYGKPYCIANDQQLMWFADKIPASRVVDLFLELIIPLQEIPLEEVEGDEMVPYQEHGPADVDEQGSGIVDGVEKHGPVTVDGPPDVELHGPSNVNWADTQLHARVNKEAGNKDKGNQVLEEGQGEAKGEAEGEGEVEAQDDADILVESDYEQEADDIAAETCVDPTKIWDGLNVPNRQHQ
ncbi:hypothetical protein Q3G72_011542 [Acer saccharum]|nr:hypothetical protein Q3G72_011542 [Acer saccharum]